jgi:hypothetical protein
LDVVASRSILVLAINRTAAQVQNNSQLLNMQQMATTAVTLTGSMSAPLLTIHLLASLHAM